MRLRSGRPADDGFTIVEVMVALALISAMMATLGTYFVAATRTSRYQAQVQTATRLAQTGMEAARGYGGPTLLVGRARCGACAGASGFDALGYLADTVRWDAPVAAETPTVPLPDVAERTEVNGVVYQRFYFVGRCWQAAGGGDCGADATLPAAMVRLVVGVTWHSADCRADRCARAATSLFSADPTDPVFAQ